MKKMCSHLQTEDFNKKRYVYVSSVNYIMVLLNHFNISTDVGIFLSVHRCPIVRSGSNSGRVKRVVSCKRKSHHPLPRRKQPGKTLTSSNDDGQQQIFASGPSEFPVITKTGDTDLDQDGCSLFREVRHVVTALITHLLFGHNHEVHIFQLSRDHGTMSEVLSGRNLRLKVSSTLWHRNVGELLAYFLRFE